MRMLIGVMGLLLLCARAEANEFSNAQEFVARYQQGGDLLLLQLYVKGITDGFGFSNGLLANNGQKPLFCPPQSLPLVDAQYVAILANFLKRIPSAGSQPPGAVLLFALQDQFPCAK